MKKNLLIIGPIGDKGGREIEAGFVANVLKNRYNVEILTTGFFYKNSDVTIFKNEIPFTGIDKIIYDSSFIIRLITNIICTIKRRSIPNHFRVSSFFIKKIFNLKQNRIGVLRKKINNNNIILIFAQLESNYIKAIIEIAYKNNLKIFFRTTGNIKYFVRDRVELFKKVDCFIHHSPKNKNNFEKHYYKHNFEIIDQCSLIEKDLLSIPTKIKKITTFLVLSRLSNEKRVDRVIKGFKNVCNNEFKLIICGEGEAISNLKIIAKNNVNILFKGHVNQYMLKNLFLEADCFIVSSDFETGPITGIEAMASGVPIISTKVGAMEERLGSNCIWYNGSVKDLEKKMLKIIEYNDKQVEQISLLYRNLYLEKFTIKNISNRYINVLEK